MNKSLYLNSQDVYVAENKAITNEIWNSFQYSLKINLKHEILIAIILFYMFIFCDKHTKIP